MAPAMTPWLVLGIVIGIVLLALAGLVAALLLRSAPRPAGPGEADAESEAEDDLPGFLEHPPGSSGAPSTTAAGWPALGGTPAPAAAPPPAGSSPQTRTTLAAMASTAVLLVGVAAALAVAARSPAAAPGAAATTSDPSPSATPETPGGTGPGALAGSSVAPGRRGLEARLVFGGVVLERRAVGVIAAYPRVAVSTDGREAVAHVELPTFNCLTDQAPADPVAAGCLVSLTEYADLAGPDLTVVRDGDDSVRVSGRFPTYLRPNGTPPEWTGRVYELTIGVEPRPGAADEGWRPAAGVLELGPDRATTAGRDGNELRSGG